MVKFFSWMIVGAILLYALGMLSLPLFMDTLIPVFFIAAIIFGVIGAIGLIISVIVERVKDKKEEDKDDYSKY